MTRQQRRWQERQDAKAASRKPQKFRRRSHEDKLTPEAEAAWALARPMLMTSERATPPKDRAIRKMVRYLLASPLHMITLRHQRGSWRSWPSDIGRAA